LRIRHLRFLAAVAWMLLLFGVTPVACDFVYGLAFDF
jgi:hypothetical protein